MLRALLFLATVGLVACGKGPEKQEIDGWLKEKAEGSDTFRLTEFEPGPWDRVVIISPYPDWDGIADSASVAMPSELREAMDMNDGDCAVAFAEGDKIVGWALASRGVADFDALAGRCVPRAEASFEVKIRRSDQWKVVVLAAIGT